MKIETKKTNFAKKNAGYSLMEMMIAIGLSSIMALATNAFIQAQYNNVKNSDQKMEINDLEALLSWRLSMKSVCESNLSPGGRPVQVNTSNPAYTNVSLSALYYSNLSTTPIIRSGQRIAEARNNITVSSINFTNFQRISSTNEYLGSIKVSFAGSSSNTSLARDLAPISIPISVFVDSNGRVLECNTPDSDDFRAEVVQTIEYEMSAYRTQREDIDLTTLNQGYNYLFLYGRCACWDDDPGKWSRLEVQFLDSSGGLLSFSHQLCFENSSLDFDESFSRANYDTGNLIIRKPTGNVRYLRFQLTRSTTSCRPWAILKTIR